MCSCGHDEDRHVRGSSGRRYCVERGCPCGNFEQVSSRTAETFIGKHMPDQPDDES